MSDNPRRVLLVSAANSIHTARWANSLSAAGIEIHVATTIDALGQDYAPGVTLHRLPTVGRFTYLADAPALRRLVRRLRPDLVNAHYVSNFGTLTRLALLGSRVPWLLTAWGSDVYRVPEQGAVHRRMVQANLRAATAVASSSRAMADRIHELAPDVTVHLTPFGIDTDLFAPSPSTAPADRADGPTVLGTVKGLEATYGIDVLIRAFALAREELGDGLRLEVYGQGSQRSELETLAASLGVADAVRFAGAIGHDRVPEVLRGLDIFAALSRWESFGVAILEASAVGLPVVVSDAPGPMEVTRDGVTGLVVPREDAVAASAAIVRLARDPQLRARMGAAGRDLVESGFSWPHSVRAMLAAYRATLEAARRR